MNISQQASLLPESRALIEVLSRLAPIKAVVDNSVPGELPLSICFEDGEAFRPFIGLLKSFKGNLRWLPVSRLAYTCIIPTLAIDSLRAVPREQARVMAIDDIRALTAVVERELNLAGVASKGVSIAQAPSCAGHPGPGGPDVDDDAIVTVRTLNLTLPSEEILRQWAGPLAHRSRYGHVGELDSAAAFFNRFQPRPVSRRCGDRAETSILIACD